MAECFWSFWQLLSEGLPCYPHSGYCWMSWCVCCCAVPRRKGLLWHRGLNVFPWARLIHALPSYDFSCNFCSLPYWVNSVFSPHTGSCTIQIFVFAFVLLNDFAALFRAEVMRIQVEPLTCWEKKANAGWGNAGNTFGGLRPTQPSQL